MSSPFLGSAVTQDWGYSNLPPKLSLPGSPLKECEKRGTFFVLFFCVFVSKQKFNEERTS